MATHNITSRKKTRFSHVKVIVHFHTFSRFTSFTNYYHTINKYIYVFIHHIMVAQILKAPLAQAQTALVNKYILWNAGICFTAKLLRKTAYGRKI